MHLQYEDRSFISLARHISDAVVLTDREGCIVWTNHAFHQLCGYTHKETQGRKPGHLLQGKNTDPATAQALRHAVQSGNYIRTEMLNYHKKGHPYWVSIAITPIKNDSEEVEGFMAIQRELTHSQLHIEALELQVTQVYSTLLLSEAEKP
ncbi:MAG: PAS domain S-box-containing protein [Lentimonas sp.]|jgi:PAS domain S-box-containing protein